MNTLIVGATGATGRLLVGQLLEHGHKVTIIVRGTGALPEEVRNNSAVTIVTASLLELSDAELVEYVRGCGAVASCLGHTLNFRGIWGKPRKLVTEATRRLCRAIEATSPARPVKFVLMNTTGNSNGDLHEPRSLGERCVIGLFRALVPPQSDNEQAAEFLRAGIGHHNEHVQWVAVRPDSLVNEPQVTPYTLHPSPTRSPVFYTGSTSRINVAHFMARLITSDELWGEWCGQMPVIYNSSES